MRTFFAYLDILGFKQLFKRNNSTELHQIVNECIKTFNHAVNKSTECQYYDVNNSFHSR